jgi:hypothetical protein
MTKSTKDYTKLVNEHKIRSGIRRAFTGEVGEVVAELLQNSQRAGARTVDARTEYEGEPSVPQMKAAAPKMKGGPMPKRAPSPAPIPSAAKKAGSGEWKDQAAGRFCYSDDGHGLSRGKDSFHDLLSMGDSGYDRPEVEQQHPMGIGINSLLALEGVKRVVLRSNGLRLSIDTHSWWEDEGYYTTWADRVEADPLPVDGLAIEADLAPGVLWEFEKCFLRYDRGDSALLAVTGYGEVFDALRINGVQADTAIPSAVLPFSSEPLVDTDFDGSRLRVWHVPPENRYDYSKKSLVSWYGQLIPIHIEAMQYRQRFFFHLQVGSGTPVTPKSPTRDSIVKDAKWDKLNRAIVDALFASASDESKVETWTAKAVKALYHIDRIRASRTLFFVAAPVDEEAIKKAQTHAHDGSSYDEPPDLEVYRTKEISQLMTISGVVRVIGGEGKKAKKKKEEEKGFKAENLGCLGSFALPEGTVLLTDLQVPDGWEGRLFDLEVSLDAEPFFVWADASFFRSASWRLVPRDHGTATDWKPLAKDAWFLKEDFQYTFGDVKTSAVVLDGNVKRFLNEFGDYLIYLGEDDQDGQEENHSDCIATAIREFVGKDVIEEGFTMHTLSMMFKKLTGKKQEVESIKVNRDKDGNMTSIDVVSTTGTAQTLRVL